jgi:hypothetical protein
MPPQSKKAVEPTHKLTRSKTDTASTPKYKPKYYYFDEESGSEETLSEPNQTAEQSINMSESDHEDEDNRRGPAPVMPALPPIPGVFPEILQLFQLMQQQSATNLDASERRAERRAKRQGEENRTAMRLMTNQIANIANSTAEKSRTPTVRLPNFDINKDAKSFPQWKSRWDTYIKANNLHTIEDPEERNERQMGELKAAFTDNTLR